MDFKKQNKEKYCSNTSRICHFELFCSEESLIKGTSDGSVKLFLSDGLEEQMFFLTILITERLESIVHGESREGGIPVIFGFSYGASEIWGRGAQKTENPRTDGRLL